MRRLRQYCTGQRRWLRGCRAAVRVKLADGLPVGKPREAWLLSRPSLAATTGVGAKAIEVGSGSATLAPYSAQVWRWN